MSLQVWLPLNGDLHSQGLTDITVTNNGATVNAEGKIGSCYSFNGSNNYLKFNYAAVNYFKEYSVAFWVNLNNVSNNKCVFSGRKGVGFGQAVFFIANKIRQDNSPDSGSTTNTTYNYSFSANKWYHIVLTQTSTQRKLYVNGNLEETVNTPPPTTSTATRILIGASASNDTSNPSGNYLNGYLNDFRIYNHALSTKEVREIAKGLLLHYKLDQAAFYQANKLTTASATTTAYKAYQITLNSNFVAGNTYTLQLANVTISHSAKTADTLGPKVYWGGGYIQIADFIGPNYIVDGKADYLQATFIPKNTHSTSSNAYIQIYNSPPNTSGTMSLTIQNYRIVEGEIPSYISDCSGWHNDGIIFGNLSFSTETPKYSHSCQFSNNLAKIRPLNLQVNGIRDSYTFAWWQYNTGTSNNMAWGFGDGNRLNLYQTTTMSWNTGDGSTNLFKTASGGNVSRDTYKNAWHHFCVTGDGTTSKLYVDGQYLATALTYKSVTGNILWISGWDAGTSYTFNGCKLSDFRIYATALSAEDVKDLYESSASIDNFANAYGREIIEADDTLSINKQGQFIVNDIEESNSITTASLTKVDKKLKTNTLYEY